MTAGPDPTLVHDYLARMRTAQGLAVSRMFTADGVIDDYRGGHRAGREVIREFMDLRPSRTIEVLGPVIVEGRRLTAYTRMSYQDGRGDKMVRFIFTTRDGLIEHLCNSEVEFVPRELLHGKER